MSEREFGPRTGLLKRRLWGSVAIVVILAFVGASILVFDTTVSQNGEQVQGFFATGDGPPSPWIFALAALAMIILGMTVHRLGGPKEDDD
jgi:MYXO-CTERM domain-containing protein